MGAHLAGMALPLLKPACEGLMYYGNYPTIHQELRMAVPYRKANIELPQAGGLTVRHGK